MDNQKQQAEQDDNCSSAASDFIQLDQPTAADGSLQEEQQEHENGSLFNPNVIDWSTMDARSTIGDEFNELKLKMATLEAKNQMLEGKLENHELKAQNRALINEKNEALKMKDAEEKVQMAKNEFAQKMEQLQSDFANKLTTLEQQQNNKMDKMVQEIAELKVKNQTLVVENKTFGEKLKAAEEKAQKLEQTQTNLHNVEEFCKEMAALKEQQQKAVNWDQMKPDVLWARLFGIGI